MVYTTKDIAQRWGVHYESCRAYIERHKADIEGEFYQKGRTTFFTDRALEVLEESRQGSPIVVQNIEADETMKLLQAKVTAQAEKIAAQAEELRNQDKLLNDSKIALLEAQNRAEKADREEQRANALENELKALEDKYEALKHRSLWQRIRNKE